MSENNELIPILECRQPAVIDQNLMDLSAHLLRVTETVKAMPKTRESLPEIRRVRAEMNKYFNSLETQRKLVKAEVLLPYEQANKVYEDMVKRPIKEADALCKGFVEDVENAVKKECEDTLREYFTELCQMKGVFWLPFERLGIKVTLAMADQKEPKKAMEMIRQRVEQVDQDLAVISGMEESADILAEYERTLDLSTAISNVQNRKRAIEIMEENKAKWDNVQKAKQQNLQHIAENAQEAAKVIQESQKKRYAATFTVTATIPMLRGLKAFLDGHNYEYQEVNE